MEKQQDSAPSPAARGLQAFNGKDWLLFLMPILFAAATFAYMNFAQAKPAVLNEVGPGEVTIEAVNFPEPGVLQIEALNGRQEEITIPQVLVDDAYWDYVADPSNVIPAGGKATFTLPYPWVVGEKHLIRLISSRGETFDSEAEANAETSAEASTDSSVE